MKLLSLYFPRLVWGSGLIVLALFLLSLQANATAAILLPQSGGFDVDAFDTVIITAIQQTPITSNVIQTTISYTVAAQLAVRIDTYREGYYDFGVHLPSDAQNVQVTVDDSDIACSAGGNCRAYYDCIVVILLPQCFSINSTVHVSYQRTVTVKSNIVGSANVHIAQPDFLRPFPFDYRSSKYGGSGFYDVRIDWRTLQQPGQAPLRYRIPNLLNYTATATDASSVNLRAGVTDDFNFTVELWRQKPLLFIPGIAGSKLVANGNELWPGVFLNWRERQPLALDPRQPPLSSVIAPDVIYTIGSILGKPLEKVYGPMLTFLQEKERYVLYEVKDLPERRTAQGCDYAAQQQKYPTLFVFAYDWRKTNAENAALLADYVGCIQQFYPDVQLDLLAHSMGGLVTRRYLLDHTSSPVNRVITVGSPWLGTPKAILALETGEFLGFGGNFLLSLSNDKVKALVRYFAGFHELLPSQFYFGKGLAPFIENGWDIDEDGNAFEVYTYLDLQRLLNKRFPAVSTVQAPMVQNELFHTPAQDFQAENSAVDYFHLYGDTGAHKTIVQVVATEFVTCVDGNCFAEPTFDVVYGPGDATVTIASATRGNAAAAQQNTITYKRVTGSDMDHTGMLHTQEVQDYVRAIVEGSPFATMAQAASTAAPLATTAAYYLRAINVISPTVVDELGNGFAVDGSSVGNALIDATHDRLGERAHAFVLPVSGAYTLTFQIGMQPAALLLMEGDGVTLSHAVRYLDLAFPTTRTLMLKLPFSTASLQQDSNGDGVTDTIITPRSDTTGLLASDTTPPTITVTALNQGPLRQLTLTAQDDQAGVQTIYYSTDGRQYQPYTTPFTVDPAQLKTIFVFAEDRVANRSALLRATVATLSAPSANPRLYLPLVARPGIVTPPPATPTPPVSTPTPLPNATPTPIGPTPVAPSLLDPTFGADGRVVTALGHSYGVDLRSVSAYQPDGKLLGGNGHTLFRVTAQGGLDRTFGDGGFVTLLPTIYDIALQTDGKIIVVGALYEDGLTTIADFTLVRYLPNGRLDPTFATNGLLRIAHQSTKFVKATHVVLQPDGKLLLLGNLPYQNGDIAATPVLIRLLSTGAFDTTFGDGGKYFFKDAAYPYLAVSTLNLQADGKILVGGNTGTGSDDTAAVLWRLQPTGTPDPTFDGDGKLITTFGADLHSINEMAFQADGKIVMAVSAPYGPLQADNLEIVRLQPDGTLDPTFANGGRATVDLQDDSGEAAIGIVVLPDGKLLVSGTLNRSSAPVLVRFSNNGLLDTSYGVDGVVALNAMQTQPLYLAGLLLQPDGNVVLVGSSNLWQADEKWLTLVRLLANGNLDGAFDGDGVLLLSPGNSVATTAALQPDGKLLVGGYTSDNRNGSPAAWTILRYMADGTLDPTFADDGKIVTAFQEGPAPVWVQALALQPDGKIVALGQLYFPNSTWPDQAYDTGLLRYNPDGTLDPTFANQGQWQTRLALTLDATSHPLALQPDGKIVILGNRMVDGQVHFVLVRLNSDGSLDATLDGDGQVSIPFDSSAEARALALQPDGKIVVAGRARTAENFEDAFVLVRYQANGALDLTFDGDGQLFTPFQQTEGAYAIAVQADGKLVAAGVARGEDDNSRAAFALLRYLPEGILDATFDGDGKVFTNFAADTADGMRALLLQPDGKIVGAGYTSDEYNRNFALARYLPTGAIDPTFACGGLVQTDLGATSDMVTALARQPDGKLIAVGYTYYTMALARYLSDASCK